MPELVRGGLPPGRISRHRQPTFGVDELTLRPWDVSDVDAVVDAYQDPDIQRWHVRTMTRAEAHSWVTSWPQRWAAESGASWAVADMAGLVGRTGFNRLVTSEASADAAYWTVRRGRGRNVAPRALRAVTEWMITVGGLHRLELSHSVANGASCRVAEKAGYAYEGTRRSQGLHADGWHDMHLHARLPEDRWAPPSPPPHTGDSR